MFTIRHTGRVRENEHGHTVQTEIITSWEPERALHNLRQLTLKIRWRWYIYAGVSNVCVVGTVPSNVSDSDAICKASKKWTFHANTKSWRNLFTSSPATLFTWLHALVFISPSLSFFSRSLLLAAQRPVFLILTTVPLLTILVHLYPYSTVLLEARNVNHNNQLFHPLGKLVPSRSDMTVGRARAYCHGFHVYIGFQRLSVECWNWAFTH